MTDWNPIENASKNVPKGFVRVYSYKPESAGRNIKLPRVNSFDRMMGYRECDQYMDIPEPKDTP